MGKIFAISFLIIFYAMILSYFSMVRNKVFRRKVSLFLLEKYIYREFLIGKSCKKIEIC